MPCASLLWEAGQIVTFEVSTRMYQGLLPSSFMLKSDGVLFGVLLGSLSFTLLTCLPFHGSSAQPHSLGDNDIKMQQDTRRDSCMSATTPASIWHHHEHYFFDQLVLFCAFLDPALLQRAVGGFRVLVIGSRGAVLCCCSTIPLCALPSVVG